MRPPRPRRSTPFLVVASLLLPSAADAQGVVVDQGRFTVRLHGDSIGTEDFSIRRAGLGRDDAIFANATVALSRDGRTQQIRPLLRATPIEGAPIEYQVEVEGVDPLELGLRRVGRRYVANIHSSLGEEQREFPAEATTRILEPEVAHLYYFLRDAQPGSVIPVVAPRSRERLELTTGPSADEEIRVGSTILLARRVDFSNGEDRRTVWFDPLGRVLRVEIPARGYLAERLDLMR